MIGERRRKRGRGSGHKLLYALEICNSRGMGLGTRLELVFELGLITLSLPVYYEGFFLYRFVFGLSLKFLSLNLFFEPLGFEFWQFNRIALFSYVVDFIWNLRISKGSALNLTLFLWYYRFGGEVVKLSRKTTCTIGYFKSLTIFWISTSKKPPTWPCSYAIIHYSFAKNTKLSHERV